MSDFSQGPGWWLASDGKWYPPQGEATAPAADPTPSWGAPQTQAPAYGAQPNYAAYGQQGSGLPSVNGMAVASMVLGIVALVFCWCFYVGGPCALVGLPLGAIALSKINKGEADPKPKGMAIAGLICSIIALAIVIVFVVWIFSVGNGTYWWSRT